ncbi:NAD(P)H-binding protein [Streptomyces bicolor]|uniref:NAD(P)H-binding protein n=1 Tax=Streptomyces bicolor TaxID=66874 RepID=UPI0022770F94|nr:NAD(P)H-binding protein [Streptomyces bicolor]
MTGAAGEIGGVSRTMVDMLLEQGHPVRAFVRQDDERAHSLRQAGAEVFVGDLLTIADVAAALTGRHAGLLLLRTPARRGPRRAWPERAPSPAAQRSTVVRRLAPGPVVRAPPRQATVSRRTSSSSTAPECGPSCFRCRSGRQEQATH